jgi:thioredoxin reductase (NADPH)
MSNEIFDVSVVGSGPSGLTASIYLTRGAMSTIVFGGSTWGGQLMLTTEIDNFPGFPDGINGPDLMLKMRAQTEKFGATFLQTDVTRVDLAKNPFEITANGSVYQTRAIIIATGAATIWLDAPGVKERIGRGVSSCAPCDAPFFKDKKVAIVGGGDSAMEEALVLTKYASEVMIIHRRNEFRASEAMQKKVLENPKIKVLWNTEVKEVKGVGKVESVTLLDNVKNVITEVPIDGIFIAIGHKPQSELFNGQIDIDERGFVKIIKPHSITSKPGVFVAGDVADPYYKQAITAAGSGCAAAMDALHYLDENKG